MNTLVVICALFASSSALSEHDNGHDDHDEHEPVFSPRFIGGARGLEGIYFFGGELEDEDKAPEEVESRYEPGIHPLNNAFGPPPGRRR